MPTEDNTILAHLKRVSFFAGLEEEGLKQLAQQCRRRKFGQREALFHEGDAGNTLYIILSGCVNIEKAGPALETIHIVQRGPGEHFGEFALLDDLPRSADAVTDTTCDLLMLDRPHFKKFLEENPAAAWKIIRSLTARLREAAAQTVQSETQDVLGRLAAFLVEVAEQCEPNAGGREIPRLTEEQIAQRIGTTRESVSRKMALLKDMKAIRREGRAIVVINLPKLRARCGGGR